MKSDISFTEGKIVKPLIMFAFPVMLALFLQAMYGAVDLMIVGKFAGPEDVSAVSTGTMIMATCTYLVTNFAMGTTILLGQLIGKGQREEGGKTVGTAIIMFVIIAVVLSIILLIFAPVAAGIMNAPEEAFDKTVIYIRICGGGMLAIVAYNLIGCIFRGLGDSHTPLMTVAIACVFNIIGDLILCAGFKLGAAGAAAATVCAQIISVFISLKLIRRKKLPFNIRRKDLRINRHYLVQLVQLGAPIALQDILVSISFLITFSIVNRLGLTASAGVGVAEKVCSFIMLISAAFMQSMSAFVAQNYGAGKMDRAKKALHYGMCISFSISIAMFLMTYFKGNIMAGMFTSNTAVIGAAADFLRAYAIDCMFTALFFCYIGFYNGIGHTRFVMLQGIIGAFCFRVPVAYFMSLQPGATLFHIGLATPASSIAQFIMGTLYMRYLKKKGIV